MEGSSETIGGEYIVCFMASLYDKIGAGNMPISTIALL